MSATILLVEDDPSLSALICDYLAIAGCQLDTAADGLQGLEKALAGSFDLMILDIMLPGMDGFEISRRFRAVSDKPLIILSARREDIDKIRGLGLGADDYMTKPFSPSELVARVKAHLSRYERLTGGRAEALVRSIEIRSLSLDPEARKVRVSGREVDLAPKEFELLRLLMRNPDKVFSKEEIFDRIWGEDRYGDLSTVTVHVRKIREKIESNPSEPDYLETVWGMGYRVRV
ncbi:MAG: DNA-binding response regulator [Spirochaetes bacterium GWB1_59_5]|nr:MAG: DNA-binding response regulator [Spirochaetes bacterium GWB1_59_5]